MQNPICISTGFLYKLFDDKNEIIERIKEFSPEGIELCIANSDYLLNFKISDNNLRYLRNLKFISIHAPWQAITYGNNQKSKDVLITIEKLYKQIGARNVVFSNKELVTDFNSITSYDFIASIENDDWRKPSANTPKEIRKILSENQNLKFTFDFAHALTVSSIDIPLYINKFKDKLIEIHLAFLNRKFKDHWFLHKYDSKKIRILLNHLKNTNVPICLECVALDQNEIQLIRREIEYIKMI